MRDGDKTKAQLMSELNELRRQNAKLARAENEHGRAQKPPVEVEKRYRDFLDNLSDIAYETDSAGKVTYANKASEKITGVPLKDIIGKPFLPLFTEESQTKALDVYQRTLKGESPEYELTFKNGRVCHYKSEPLRDDSGKIVGLFGIARDITKQIRAHAAIRQRNRELSLLNRIGKAFSSTLDLDQLLVTILEEVRSLLKVVACSVWLLDQKTGELVCRQAIGPWRDSVCGWRLAPGQRVVGWEAKNAESLIIQDSKVDGRHFKGVADETGIEMRSILSVPLLSKKTVLGVLEVMDAEVDRFKYTERKLIELLATPAAIAVENARLYEAAQQELRKRKKAQEAMQQSKQKFRVLFDHLPILAFVVDKTHRLIACNESFYKIMGNQVGKRTVELEGVSKEVKHLWQTVEKQVIDSGLPTWYTELFNSANGDRLYYDKRMQPIKNQNGRVSMVINIASDITHEIKRQVALAEEVEELRHQITAKAGQPIIGKSRPIREILSRIKAIAATDTTVLLTGESGTGKELAAEAIHSSSKRSQGPLIKINCAALPESIIESELFGHVKGAFSGAVSSRLGRFEAADSGTIFLDEIGDVSPAVQLRLLRVLEEKKIERVGDYRAIKIDVRIIAATNQNLDQLVEGGRFREDLYYRLNVFRIDMPPLRDRLDDLPLLVAHFLSQFSKSMDKEITSISNNAMTRLLQHSWPGNIRELMNVIESGSVLCHGSTMKDEHLSALLESRPLNLKMDREVEIRNALRDSRGNKAQAARLLGIARTTLYRRMKPYGIVAD